MIVILFYLLIFDNVLFVVVTFVINININVIVLSIHIRQSEINPRECINAKEILIKK